MDKKQDKDVERESEQIMASVFLKNPVSMTIVIVENGKFIDVNETFCRNTGYTREEVIGKTSEDIGLFADKKEYKRFVKELKKFGKIFNMELKCRIKSGEIRICSFSSGMTLIGNRPYILSTVEDITEQKATEVTFQAVVKSMVKTSGSDSLKSITETICSWLGADCVMIGMLQPDGNTIKVLSVRYDGMEQPLFSYDISGSPCESVVKKGFCEYPDNVALTFPGNNFLRDLNIIGYIGVPLTGYNGEVLGLINVMFKRAIFISPSVRVLLGIIALKALAEIRQSEILNSLKESKRKLAEAMEMANLANWEYDVKTNIFTFDDRFYALYRTTEELEDSSMMTAETYATRFVHPEDRNMVFQEIEKAINTKDPDYLSIIEHRIIRRDGSCGYISVRIRIIKDDKGRTIKTHGVNQDITEQRLKDEAIRESEIKFRSFVENAKDIIFSMNPDGTFAYVSPRVQELLGYDPGDLKTKAFDSFVHPDDLAGCKEFLIQFITKGEKKSGMEFRVRSRNGLWYWHAISCSPLYDEEGKIILINGIIHDITERKKAEDTVRQVNKQLNMLSDITRHDIINKISVINGLLEVLKLESREPEFIDYLNRIESATVNIESMIDFSRIYQVLGTNEPQWLDLNSIMPWKQIPDTLLFTAHIRGISIFADPMLEKAFFNILDNSIRHGEHVTRIQAYTNRSADDLIIIWEDNGVGIATEDKERIFDRGFGKNSGHGMFLAKEILLLTEIQIIETGVPGKGARFEITVPKEAFRVEPTDNSLLLSI